MDSILYSPIIQDEKSSDFTALTKYKERYGCRFQYISDDTIVAGKQTVRLLSRSMGTKRSALVIDACFAEIFDSCTRTSMEQVIIDNSGRRVQWAGLSIFAEEVRHILAHSVSVFVSFFYFVIL